MTVRTELARGACAAGMLVILAGSAGAQGLVKTSRLSASLAAEAVVAAVEACAQQSQAVTAVILDTGGVAQAMLRGDDAGIHTVETADAKAYTAVTFKVDTIELVERAHNGPVSSAIAKLPRLLLAQGGVVIKAGAEVIGAIGVSGAKGNAIDTQCARAGLDKISDRLK
jgi:uncharacterized protein GlcG (DUF336 family)